MFVQQLDLIQTIAARRFEEYGADLSQVEALKARFARWAADLRSL